MKHVIKLNGIVQYSQYSIVPFKYVEIILTFGTASTNKVGWMMVGKMPYPHRKRAKPQYEIMR
jgi:hypothetical protein